jgi:hypothetical protein
MILGRDPVLWLMFIQALIGGGTAFFFTLTDLQMAALNTVTLTLLSLLARSQVTPVRNPRLVQGTEVEFIPPKAA